ncbi:FecCD family ABC transporter permease [Chelativorans sp. YIM 93263]|uniref:FecCD family ABC transporter permease n=1 Tax=Chelativorans sp. YIM 93263 TaxID=2906648 RepID=UPI002379DF78|nr:iron ABC transporter permease [Chelativorans sp. YIM 93263]
MKRAFLILGLLVPVLAAASLQFGVHYTSPAEVWRALTVGGDDQAALIVTTLRVPRTIIAVLVGAGLGLSGLLMQTVTRNPLAEPGLLGINAGAAFAAVLMVTLLGIEAPLPLTLAACAGALTTATLIYCMAWLGNDSASPLHLLLAGLVMMALLTSGVQVALVSSERAMEELLFWLSGAFTNGQVALLLPAALIMGTIAACCVFSSRLLDVLTADDATAGALGVPVVAARGTAFAAAAILAGISVALAGSVNFVGLAAPHLARRLGARSHIRLIPLSMLAGASLALAADIASRFLIYPAQAPVGAVLAMIGVPVLLMLLRRKGTAAA